MQIQISDQSRAVVDATIELLCVLAEVTLVSPPETVNGQVTRTVTLSPGLTAQDILDMTRIGVMSG